MSRLHRMVAVPLLTLLVGCAHAPGQAPQWPPRPEPVRSSSASGPAELRPETLEDRLRKGDALRADGSYAAAMWIYLQAHETAPERPEPMARMASLHLLVDPERAESIFRDLVETHPESSAALTGLGLALIARNDWAAARNALDRAATIEPRSVAALSALGVSLDRVGRHREARDAYLRALEVQPQHYEALNNLGVSYLTTEEFEAAEEVLRRASREQQRDPAVFNNLGLALGRMQRYGAALEAFQRGGSEQAARNNLGYVCFLNGDYERAVAEYEKALLVGGDQKLLVLRNLVAAQRAGDALANAAP